jgi:hypothetical protein
MTGSELLAEAERLIRPCVHLKSEGPEESFAAVWDGPGLVSCPVGSFRHWLSIDCRYFPEGLGLSSGCLSVYTNEEHSASSLAIHDINIKLECKPGGAKLFAHATRSLPPIDAVFRFGSSILQDWLTPISGNQTGVITLTSKIPRQ